MAIADQAVLATQPKPRLRHRRVALGDVASYLQSLPLWLILGVFLGVGNGAVFKLVPADFPDNPGAAAGVVGAAGGLGGFFPPIFVGLMKDAEGTYTYGFVGLLVFVALSLLLAVWLLRMAPPDEVRGVRA